MTSSPLGQASCARSAEMGDHIDQAPQDKQLDRPADHPEIIMAGRLIALGTIRHDLQPVYERWNHARSALQQLGDLPGLPTMTMHRDWLVPIEPPGQWLEESWYTIYDLERWQPIGCAALLDIDLVTGSAELALFIGEESARGKGYGSEATRLMLDYAFTALRLDSVATTISEFNLAGLHICTAAGFREIDRCRRLRGGLLWDEILLECLAGDFTSLMR